MHPARSGLPWPRTPPRTYALCRANQWASCRSWWWSCSRRPTRPRALGPVLFASYLAPSVSDVSQWLGRLLYLRCPLTHYSSSAQGPELVSISESPELPDLPETGGG